MKKTFVALILIPLIALVMCSIAFAAELPPADNLGIHALVADSIDTSLVTAATPGYTLDATAPSGAVAVIPNFATILSLDSYRMLAASARVSAGLNVLDKRALHGSRCYAHILWSPELLGGSATAATQRTRAVSMAMVS